MAEITASMVKELREKTDAPMMECKKALTEAGGDWPRPKRSCACGWATRRAKPPAASRPKAWSGLTSRRTPSSARSSKSTARPISSRRTTSSSPSSRNLAELVAKHNPADVAALVGAAAGRRDGRQVRSALVGKIGENMSIRRFTRIEAKGRVASYVHGGSKIGVLVDVVGGDETLAKDLAMHIAASKPVALVQGRSAGRVDRERARHRRAEGGRIGQAGRTSSRRWSRAACRSF